jgi:hypothetical protein
MTTTAGKRLWEFLDRVQPGANGDVLRMGSIRSAIAAIEAEAVAARNVEIAEAVRGLETSPLWAGHMGYEKAKADIIALVEAAPKP